jgi:PAS domain S-box-containing protein
MKTEHSEDRLLQSVALQNAAIILKARQRAEQELVEAKDELRRSNETLKATFEQAAIGIGLADLEGRFVDANRRFAEILGYSREEMLGLGFLDITHPEDVADTEAHLRRLLSGEVREYSLEKRYLRRDGASVWSNTSVTLVRDQAGRPMRFIGAVEDITRRKETEEQLRRSNEFNRTVIESSRDCIKTLALDGTLLWISERGQRTLCVEDAAEILGKCWVDFWDPSERQAAREALAEAIQDGNADFVGHFPIDGATRWWEVAITPIFDSAGKPESLLAVSRDITERVALEEERKQLLESERAARAAAERASRMKDDFLATLSHELRTPLGAILGWSQLLRTGTMDPDNLVKGLETIERNARVQTQLIEDLLDMSRITSGKVRLDIQPVDPATVVEAAIETVGPSAEAKGIAISRVLDPNAGLLSGDPGRLQQMVWNLLSNAIKFTAKGGKVQVVLHRVNSHIEISVADTGAGIDPEFLPRIFERFSQADGSSTRTFGGLGLGLAIVKHLVELHGGSIVARSAGLGRGATFTLQLPLSVVQHDTKGRVHPRSVPTGAMGMKMADLSGVKVLMVDDEPDGRELVKRVLSECGAAVATAASASEALSRLEADWPDVLLTDIGMPHVDGYELLRHVRALQRGRYLPAVALTAFARSEDRIRALNAGFALHLSKPVEPSELIATVASVAKRAEAG